MAEKQEPPAVQVAQCRKCGLSIDAIDNYCRHCGRPQRRMPSWYDRPAWIVLLTLFVLGPLALILVWRSPIMGRLEKWFLAIFILAYTGLLIHGCWQAAMVATKMLQEMSTDVGQLGNF